MDQPDRAPASSSCGDPEGLIITPSGGSGGETKKWRVHVEEEVAEASADRVWSIVSQFCNAQLWSNSLQRCEKVEGGAVEEAGCVRYCEGKAPFPGLASAAAAGWSTEKLLTFDRPCRTYSYAIIDSNLGLRGYIATVHVAPALDDDGASCTITLKAEMDSVARDGEDDEKEEERVVRLLSSAFRRNIGALREACRRHAP